VTVEYRAQHPFHVGRFNDNATQGALQFINIHTSDHDGSDTQRRTLRAVWPLLSTLKCRISNTSSTSW
jgi:hypothetical protein